MGTVPTISINKTDGCQVFLSQDSLKCEIISAKGSEMNVVVPNKDGEFVSIPRSAGGRGGVSHCGSLHSWLSVRWRFFSGSISRSSFVLPPPHRKSTPFPSSSRPSGMARSSSPQYLRWFDGRRETRLPPRHPPVHQHPPPSFFLRVTTFQTDPPADPRLGTTAVLPLPLPHFSSNQPIVSQREERLLQPISRGVCPFNSSSPWKHFSPEQVLPIAGMLCGR